MERLKTGRAAQTKTLEGSDSEVCPCNSSACDYPPSYKSYMLALIPHFPFQALPVMVTGHVLGGHMGMWPPQIAILKVNLRLHRTQYIIPHLPPAISVLRVDSVC